jgi:hypothetical protein
MFIRFHPDGLNGGSSRPLSRRPAAAVSHTDGARFKPTLAQIKDIFNAVRSEGLGIKQKPELQAEFCRVRDAFNRLPFTSKLDLIAEHTRGCLADAKALIAEATVGQTSRPSAAGVWEKLLSFRSANREDRRGHAELIGHLFPALETKKGEIAQALTSAYTFWISFCGCSEHGYIGTVEVETSFLRALTDGQAAMISALAGMRSLGGNLRGSADHLYRTTLKAKKTGS